MPLLLCILLTIRCIIRTYQSINMPVLITTIPEVQDLETRFPEGLLLLRTLGDALATNTELTAEFLRLHTGRPGYSATVRNYLPYTLFSTSEAGLSAMESVMIDIACAIADPFTDRTQVLLKVL